MNMHLTHQIAPLAAPYTSIWGAPEQTTPSIAERSQPRIQPILDPLILQPTRASLLFWHPVLDRLITALNGTVWDHHGNVIFHPAGAWGQWGMNGRHYIYQEASPSTSCTIHILDTFASIHHQITGTFDIPPLVNPMQPFLIVTTQQHVQEVYKYTTYQRYPLPSQWAFRECDPYWSYTGDYFAIMIIHPTQEQPAVLVCTTQGDVVYFYSLASATRATKGFCMAWHPRRPILTLYYQDRCEWIDIHGKRRWYHEFDSTGHTTHMPAYATPLTSSIKWNPQGTILAIQRTARIILITVTGQVTFVIPTYPHVIDFCWHPSGTALTVALPTLKLETYDTHGYLHVSQSTVIDYVIQHPDLFIPNHLAWDARGRYLATSLSGAGTILYPSSYDVEKF